MQEEARLTSKKIFAHWVWRKPDDARPDASETFSRQITEAAYTNAAPEWDGLVLDLSDISGESAAKRLAEMPPY